MYIKNQHFREEDALMEAIFDFSLGEATPIIQQLLSLIQKELLEDKEFQKYKATLDDDEQEATEAEEMEIRLADKLMEQFHSFEIYKQQLFGLIDDQKTLLYSIDLV